MSKFLKTKTIFETLIPKNFSVNKSRKEFDSAYINNDLIEELETIESEMLNGKSIKFKNVDELAERYEL